MPIFLFSPPSRHKKFPRKEKIAAKSYFLFPKADLEENKWAIVRNKWAIFLIKSALEKTKCRVVMSGGLGEKARGM